MKKLSIRKLEELKTTQGLAGAHGGGRVLGGLVSALARTDPAALVAHIMECVGA